MDEEINIYHKMEYYPAVKEKKVNLFIWDNIDLPWRHYVKWNESEKKMLNDSTYAQCKKVEFVETENRLVVVQEWGVGGYEILIVTTNFQFQEE